MMSPGPYVGLESLDSSCGRWSLDAISLSKQKAGLSKAQKADFTAHKNQGVTRFCPRKEVKILVSLSQALVAGVPMASWQSDHTRSELLCGWACLWSLKGWGCSEDRLHFPFRTPPPSLAGPVVLLSGLSGSPQPIPSLRSFAPSSFPGAVASLHKGR